MNKIVVVFFAALMAMILIMGVPVQAVAASNTAQLIDPDVYKAQCLAGIAYDPNTNAVEQCNKIYSYYIDNEVYSPTKSFLDSVYADHSLMASYNAWMLYSLMAEPSTALDIVATKEQYYEALVVSIYSQETVNNNEFVDALKSNAVKGSNTFLKNLCQTKGVSDTAELMRVFDIESKEAFMEITDCIKDTYKGAKGTKICGAIGTVLDYSTDIIEVSERLAMYGEMAELDEITKTWLASMYDSCDGLAKPELKSALFNLKSAGTDYAGAALADIKTAGFTLAKWGVKLTIDMGMEIITSISPVTLAVSTGFKLGKSLCDLFFDTSDTCEQLFLLECIYDIEDVARNVAKKTKSDFLANPGKDEANDFIYAVDCYFESLTNTDIDCMIKFLDNLYNGGLLKGAIKCLFGVTNDYQEAVNALENLRLVRQNNYDLMNRYYEFALMYNYPDTYELYFTVKKVVIPVTEIFYSFLNPWHPNYPAGYGDMVVGDFVSPVVSFQPLNTTQKAYYFTSDNQDVLKVNEGVLTAVGPGTANVTVTSVENPDVSYTKKITVGVVGEDAAPEENKNIFTYLLSSDGKATITGLVSGYNPIRLTIPSKIDGYPVVEIGNRSFYGCSSLTNVTIPDSVTSIGSYAFYNCDSLTSMTIPDRVTSIGFCAFSLCDSLTTVSIPDSVTSIGHSAFYYCTSLTNMTIPDRVTSIGEEMFMHCTGLTSVTVGNSVTSIGSYAFSNCTSLTSVTIPDSVTSIGDGAFSNCTSLTSVIIPDGVTGILEYTFYYCKSMISVTIPDSVTSIGLLAFCDCTNLTSITIPDSVTSIGMAAFNKCDNLSVYYTGSRTQWDEILNEGGLGWTSSTIHYNSIPDFFPDVKTNAWYFNSVSFAVEKGYFSGNGDGTFAPGKNITRQDFVVVLSRIAGANLSKYSGQTSFTDVPANAYYAKAIHWATDTGIISGYNATQFGVGDPLTREQLVTILSRYAQKKGVNVNPTADALNKMNSYSDANKINPYMRSAIAWALQNKVINGMTSTTIAPQGNATRAQVAAILMNINAYKVIPGI